MNILITGATGKLGQKLVANLKEPAPKSGRQNLEIFALVRHKTKSSDKELQGDILNPDSLKHVLRHKKIELVVHLAGLTHTYNLKDYFKVNLEGTQNIIQACQNSTKARITP